MLKVIPNKYNCGDFSKVDSIGVLCRGESLGAIGKYKKHFRNIFVAGQCYNSFKIIGKHIEGSNIVRTSGNTFYRLTEEYKEMYEEYNMRDIQTTLDPILSDRKSLKYNKLKKVHEGVLTVHTAPLKMRERNLRFLNKRKYGNGKMTYPTIGLATVDMACLYKPKSIHIIGLDFYCANVFVKEQHNRSWRKNKGRANSMIEFFQLLCKEELDIQFYLYTRCKKINSEDNLRVIRV